MSRIAVLNAPLLLCLIAQTILAAAPTTKPATRSAPLHAPAAQGLDAQALYDRVTPSLVAVQYIWENELGRQELTGAGIVVGEGGLVMTSLSMFDLPLRSGLLRVPDQQLKDFKILLPSQDKDAEEIDAVFQGRDERSNTAFVRSDTPSAC